MTNEIVGSNLIGPDDIALDRLYMGYNNKVYVINKDFTKYKGEITKKTIIVEGITGNFRSHVYKTQDGRWFDRAGLPITKPSSIEQEDE